MLIFKQDIQGVLHEFTTVILFPETGGTSALHQGRKGTVYIPALLK